MSLYEKVAKAQGIERPLKPEMDVATRWNSTYIMINRALEIQPVRLIVDVILSCLDVENHYA